MSKRNLCMSLMFGLAVWSVASSDASAQTIPASNGVTYVGVVDNQFMAITQTSGGCFFTAIQGGSTLTNNRTLNGTSGVDQILVVAVSTFVPCIGGNMNGVNTGNFRLTINGNGGADVLVGSSPQRVTYNGGTGNDRFCGNLPANNNINGNTGTDNRCGTGGANNSIETTNCPC